MSREDGSRSSDLPGGSSHPLYPRHRPSLPPEPPNISLRVPEPPRISLLTRPENERTVTNTAASGLFPAYGPRTSAHYLPRTNVDHLLRTGSAYPSEPFFSGRGESYASRPKPESSRTARQEPYPPRHRDTYDTYRPEPYPTPSYPSCLRREEPARSPPTLHRRDEVGHHSFTQVWSVPRQSCRRSPK